MRANLCPSCTVDWAQPRRCPREKSGGESGAAPGLDAAREASKQNAAVIAAEIASLIAGAPATTTAEDCGGAIESQLDKGEASPSDGSTVAPEAAQLKETPSTRAVGKGDTNEIQMDDY